MSADWKQIETEYITTSTSYRKLAEKYGIDQATISRKAKKEDWVSKRQHHLSETQAKVLAADTRRKVSRAERLQCAADKLLGKVEDLLDTEEVLEDTQSMRDISRILKDIKEIHMIKSEADIREQEARIEKLRKDAQKEDRNSTVTVVLEGALKDYAQ